jgi:hypothetical protein
MGLGRGRGLTGALFTASLVASDTSIEAALQRVQDFDRISKEAATSAADLLSNPQLRLTEHAPPFLRERLRFRAVCAWLWGLPTAASLPPTASPPSRMSLQGLSSPQQPRSWSGQGRARNPKGLNEVLDKPHS